MRFVNSFFEKNRVFLNISLPVTQRDEFDRVFYRSEHHADADVTISVQRDAIFDVSTIEE